MGTAFNWLNISLIYDKRPELYVFIFTCSLLSVCCSSFFCSFPYFSFLLLFFNVWYSSMFLNFVQFFFHIVFSSCCFLCFLPSFPFFVIIDQNLTSVLIWRSPSDDYNRRMSFIAVYYRHKLTWAMSHQLSTAVGFVCAAWLQCELSP